MMTDIINPLTAAIIRQAKDGDTIREVAKKTGFAYSAIYRWVTEMTKHDMFEIKDEGNRKRIYAKHNELYNQFAGLIRSVNEADQNRVFWAFVKKTNLKVRLTGGTAISLWTRGSYITGDFFDKVYMLEVAAKDLYKLKNELSKHKISYTEREKKKQLDASSTSSVRPLVFLSTRKDFSVERIESIPVMPLKELVEWCKRLDLDAALEHLDELCNLGLKTRYSEVHTNV
jgi:hypothetical protein